MALLPPAVGTLDVGIFDGAASVAVVGVEVSAGVTRFVGEFVAGLVWLALALFSANIWRARSLVSPAALALADFAAAFPFRLYILESAAVNILFHSSQETSGGAGAASLYLYLNWRSIST